MMRTGTSGVAPRVFLEALGISAPDGMFAELPAPDERRHVELLNKPGLGGRERWRVTVPANGGVARVSYVKRYGRTPLRVQWDRVLRQTWNRSVAWWEFEQSRRLAAANVPAVTAIAYAEDMIGPFERRSAVMFEAVPGDALDRAWRRLTRENHALTRGSARHDMTRRLARFVSAFHQTGLRHRDLYLCHIFVEFQGASADRPAFHIIDLARVFRPLSWTRGRWTVKDLSQLDVSARQIGASRTDRLRFLLAYLGIQRTGGRGRRWARQVTRKSDGVMARIARKAAG